MQEFQQQHVSRKMEKRPDRGRKERKKEGDAFLANRANKAGCSESVALPSGLQYKVIKEADWPDYPRPPISVTAHYRGTLIDGTEFR